MLNQPVHVIGAGPAGLTAAIHLARNNYPVLVHEKNNDVGRRFNEDFQGIENWTTEQDAFDFMNSMGLQINFKWSVYEEGHFFGPDGHKYTIKTRRPLFYLVERGSSETSLDQGLKQQALDLGVEFSWNDEVKTLPAEHVIIATGPKAADAVAKGLIFETDHPDGYYGFLDDRIAPKGYAYLLVQGGKATFATCAFTDFKNERHYFEKALQRMRELVPVTICNEREFGGYINFHFNSIPQDGKLYIGENAGYQDYLWGFGMRYAMQSGYLAARSIISRRPYRELYRRHIHANLTTSLANRWLFSRLGNRGYSYLLKKLTRMGDPGPVLQKHFRSGTLKFVLYLIARASYRTRLINKMCLHEDCNCVWCRHGQH